MSSVPSPDDPSAIPAAIPVPVTQELESVEIRMAQAPASRQAGLSVDQRLPPSPQSRLPSFGPSGDGEARDASDCAKPGRSPTAADPVGDQARAVDDRSVSDRSNPARLDASPADNLQAPAWADRLNRLRDHGTTVDMDNLDKAISKVAAQMLIRVWTDPDLSPGMIYASSRDMRKDFLAGNPIRFTRPNGDDYAGDCNHQIAQILGWSQAPESSDSIAPRERSVKPAKSAPKAMDPMDVNAAFLEAAAEDAQQEEPHRPLSPKEKAFQKSVERHRKEAKASQKLPAIPFPTNPEADNPSVKWFSERLAAALTQQPQHPNNHEPCFLNSSGEVPFRPIDDPLNRQIALHSRFVNPVWGTRKMLESNGYSIEADAKPTPMRWMRPDGRMHIIRVFNAEQCVVPGTFSAPAYPLSADVGELPWLKNPRFAAEMGLSSEDPVDRVLPDRMAEASKSHPVEFAKRVSKLLTH